MQTYNSYTVQLYLNGFACGRIRKHSMSRFCFQKQANKSNTCNEQKPVRYDKFADTYFDFI